MIFLTVGTTLPFDDLVRAVDNLVANGELMDKVVCQIGRGTYEPHHCEYFRFAPEIAVHIDKAAVVISHGGTGSVSDLLSRRKPFIAVANPAGVDDHQAEFLARLSERVNILWTKDLAELPKLLMAAPRHVYVAKKSDNLPQNLTAYLRGRLGWSASKTVFADITDE
jgi:beta-1,4-N-acetylglucosaminyltransferase